MSAAVNVHYYALLREISGQSEERVSIALGETASQLYLKLQEKYAFPLGVNDVRIAVNDEFAACAQPLIDGDRVVFIPPVSGG